jgi:sugar porter (SP) family MFS transporter
MSHGNIESLKGTTTAGLRSYYLLFIATIAAMGGLLFGFDMAVISGAIGYLREQFSLSPAMEGWSVSSALAACAVGAVASGILSDKFGRKYVLLFSGLLFIVCAIGCGMANSVSMLVIFRIIGGLGVGLASMVSPLYISEVSPSQVRGGMVTLYQFAITVGILLAYFSNAWVQNYASNHLNTEGGNFWAYAMIQEPWRGMFLMQIIPASLFTFLMFLVPESPRWLVKMNRAGTAINIFSKITNPTKAQEEVVAIQKTISPKGMSFEKLFTTPKLRKALFVGMCLSLFSELSGITIVIYYGADIFTKAGFTLSNALGGSVVIGAINVLFTVVAIWKIDSLGRRPLLFIGTAGAFLSLLITGFLFITGHTEGGTLIFFLSLFVACFAFSMGPIKWVVMSEIFPTKIRGQAMAVATLTVWVTVMVLNQVFPIIRESSIGAGGSFFLFAAFLFPQFFFIWKIMPETKGKTLEEIEQSMRS